jgi:hypothetical protein
MKVAAGASLNLLTTNTSVCSEGVISPDCTFKFRATEQQLDSCETPNY